MPMVWMGHLPATSWEPMIGANLEWSGGDSRSIQPWDLAHEGGDRECDGQCYMFHLGETGS